MPPINATMNDRKDNGTSPPFGVVFRWLSSAVLMIFVGTAFNRQSNVSRSANSFISASNSIRRANHNNNAESTTSGKQGRNLAGAVTIESIKLQFQSARAKLFSDLKADYGEDNFDNMFFTEIKDEATGIEKFVSLGRTLYVSPSSASVVDPKLAADPNAANPPPLPPAAGWSWDRMVRRLMKKILQYMITGEMGTFVWSTGGHSASAGHGNFYNESYTAQLGRQSPGLFKAVGMDFVARNYAMGGTPSGMELGACVKETYGMDVDMLSWDFGMCDGGNWHLMGYYFYRAAMIPSRPGYIAFEVGKHEARVEPLKQLEALGMTSFYKRDDEYAKLFDKIPDTFGKTMAEIEAMPKFLKSFKCDKGFETGDPTCAADKWTNLGKETCDNRKYKTSWHPGWKWHALQGNLMTLFLMELLEDALKEIEARGSDLEVLLNEVKAQEEADYKILHDSPLPGFTRAFAKPEDNVDVELLHRGPNICHIARLPAETRHLGILTESDEKGFFTYDKGTEHGVATDTQNPDGLMRLVYNGEDRQPCEERVIQMDFKDYFFAYQTHEKSEITLPNQAEIAAYGQAGYELKGVIAVCFVGCPWDRCPPGTINAKEFREGKASMMVNDVKVSNMTDIINGCTLLKNDAGHTWQANPQGQYTISADVQEEKGFMRFSSFVIW